MSSPRRQPPTALALALAAVVGGCTPALPDPQVLGVRPGWGFNGEDTQVEIEGQAFYPRVQASAGDRVELDHAFQIVLEADPEVELSDVALVDYRHLLGTVPAGLDVGTYDLRVVSPTGAVGRLADAFEVRDTRADHLQVTPADGQIDWQVMEYAALTVELVDPDGVRVAEDLEIQVVVEGAVDGSITFQDGTLLDQAPLDEGTGIVGRLGPDGAATIALTSDLAAEALLLGIDPVDPTAGIAGVVQVLSFTPGAVAGIRVDLPSTVFSTTAGDSFDVDLTIVDQAGNTVDGADALVVLQELCPGGGLLRSVSFAGQQLAQEVTVTAATQDGCLENAIVATGVAAGTFVQGQSAGFAVAPSEAAALHLDVWPDQVQAGEEEVLAFVTAVDDWDNRAVDQSGAIELEVSTDGGPFDVPAWSSCTAMSEGEAYCRSILEQAGSSVVLFATTTGPGAVSGVSAPFAVLAGEADSLSAAIDTDPVEAGQPFALRLLAVDALGNGVLLDPLGSDVPAFSAGGEGEDPDLACAWDRSDDGSTAEIYACTATVATDLRWIEVELPSLGLSTTSPGFSVVNGPLEQVDFSLVAAQVTAGEALSIQVRGADAWGNPYVEQDDPVVELRDDTLDLTPSTVTLGADGSAALDVVITVATEEDRIQAWQGERLLGTSDPFSVSAGPVEALEIAPAQTWAWLDEALEVVVRAVDAYGNLAVDHEALVTLQSTGGLGDAVVGAPVEGEVTLAFTFGSPGLRDLLTVDDGTLSDSATVDALDPGCAAPPTAVLTVDGDAPAVLCRLVSTGTTRSVTVSAASSTAGEAALSRFHLRDEDGTWSVGTSATWSRSWDSIGGRRLALVVADAAACGAAAEAVVYVGDPDGQPTGPVLLEADSTELSAGDPGDAGETAVQVRATDCAGDPASGGVLLARVDLGSVRSGDTEVATTGKGLQLTLDAAGEADIRVSVADETYGGSGTLMVGRTEAVAWGELALEVRNDGVRPAVAAALPAGSTLQVFDSLRLTFTEPLLATSVSPSSVRILDPDGAPLALTSDHLSLSGATLDLTPPEPVDGSLGAWTVEVDGTVRDLDGNRLAGAWGSAASDFTLRFGDVPDEAVDLDGCAVEPTTLRPDGDEGAGEEGDAVQALLRAASGPDWWWMVVRDEAGEVVRTLWRPGDGSDSAALEWDGRGDDGRILGNGGYSLTLGAADATWNPGITCEKAVALDNRLEGP
ncbi:Ig-like domain-containing protein [Myxococcota bacterium]|nr:Ig-like domain-containing protein [Myxococcota bacterium]